MALFQGVFFLVVGAGLIGMDYQSLNTGSLPCGPNGFSGAREFCRDDQPVRYWLMFSMYGLGGLALVIFAIRLLLGTATPLPLS